MKKFKKKVYVPLGVDFLHEGHINILKIAQKYGEVIVGLLTDEAIASYKSIPILNYKNRELLVKN
jgi:cytidyltransferase-related domain